MSYEYSYFSPTDIFWLNNSYEYLEIKNKLIEELNNIDINKYNINNNNLDNSEEVDEQTNKIKKVICNNRSYFNNLLVPTLMTCIKDLSSIKIYEDLLSNKSLDDNKNINNNFIPSNYEKLTNDIINNSKSLFENKNSFDLLFKNNKNKDEYISKTINKLLKNKDKSLDVNINHNEFKEIIENNIKTRLIEYTK